MVAASVRRIAIAGRVAVPVVDPLEAVDVDERDDELAVGAACPLDLVPEREPPHLAPEGAGEGVEVGALELGLQAGPLEALGVLGPSSAAPVPPGACGRVFAIASRSAAARSLVVRDRVALGGPRPWLAMASRSAAARSLLFAIESRSAAAFSLASMAAARSAAACSIASAALAARLGRLVIASAISTRFAAALYITSTIWARSAASSSAA